MHNSILSSHKHGKCVRQLKLKGKYIFWEMFEDVFEFNCSTDLRLYRNLSKEHVKVSDAGKMRNHLAINVLNGKMLNLMKIYQCQLSDPEVMNSTIELLENTSVYVDIFSNSNLKISSIYDHHIQKLLDILAFFHTWEDEYSDPKEKAKHLMSRQTWEDIDSSIFGFIEVVKVATEIQYPLVPGYFNSDLIESWFCQICGLRNGSNQNPTMVQIGPAINSNLLSGSIVSQKGNASGTGMQYKSVVPPTKKFKSKH